MAFCMSCGKSMPDGDKFCMECGAPQEAAPPVATGNQTAAPVVGTVVTPAATALISPPTAQAAETTTRPEPAGPSPKAGPPRRRSRATKLLISLILALVVLGTSSAGAWYFYDQIHREGQSFTDFYLWQMGLQDWKDEEEIAIVVTPTPSPTPTPPISAPLSNPLSPSLSSSPAFWYDAAGDIVDVAGTRYFAIYADQDYFYGPTDAKVYRASSTTLKYTANPGFSTYYHRTYGILLGLPAGWDKVKVVEDTQTDTETGDSAHFLRFFLPTTDTILDSETEPGYASMFGILIVDPTYYAELKNDPEANDSLGFLGVYGNYGFAGYGAEGLYPADVQSRADEIYDIFASGFSWHQL